MDPATQFSFSSHPLYPPQSPNIPQMVNGVQYGHGMMGAGARATEYDSRRWGGRVWESDWDTRNSRLTDDVMLPGMQFDQQPSYGNAGLHCDSTQDFTQNAPRWNPIFECPPQAHVSMHAPTIYRHFSAHPYWSEAPSSQLTGLFPYPLARTQRPQAGIVQWDRTSDSMLESSLWNPAPFQPALSLAPPTPSMPFNVPVGAGLNFYDQSCGFDLTTNYAVPEHYLSPDFPSAEPTPPEPSLCLEEPSIFHLELGGGDAMASAEQTSHENAGNILVESLTSPLRSGTSLQDPSQQNNILLMNAFTDASPNPNPALRKLLDEVLQSRFLRRQQQEPLLSDAAGRSILAKIVGLEGYSQICLRRGRCSIYSLLVKKGIPARNSNRCLICYSEKKVLARAVGCVRKHLGHRPFACDNGHCDDGPARFHMASLLKDHVNSRTQRFECIYCMDTFRRGNVKRHWESVHPEIPFPYEEYPRYSRTESNASTSSPNSDILSSLGSLPDITPIHDELENAIF